MKYSYAAKNTGKDSIYRTRLLIIDRLNIDINRSSKIYAYYMAAYLGVVLN